LEVKTRTLAPPSHPVPRRPEHSCQSGFQCILRVSRRRAGEDRPRRHPKEWQGERLKQEIKDLIREECTLLDEAKKAGEKKQRIVTLKAEEEGLLKQLPTAATEEERKILEELQKRRDELAAAQTDVAGDKQKIQKVADIKTRVTSFRTQMTRFVRELTPLLDEIGVPQSGRAAFIPAFPGDTTASLDKKVEELNSAIGKKEGAEQNPDKGTAGFPR
jgi:chromosome segregation ATPase